MRKAAVGIALIGALIVAVPAQADGSGWSAPAGDCVGEPPRETPFTDWADDGSYFLAPDGGFDGTATGWSLDDGAAVVAGGSPDGSGALSLPPGASATSPAFCVAEGYRHGRMFGAAVDHGSWWRAGAWIGVEIIEADGDRNHSNPVRVEGDWDATERFLLREQNFDLDPVTGTAQIQVRFTGWGPDRALLDGVYIDPRMRN